MIGVFSGTSDGKKIVGLLLKEGYEVTVFNGTSSSTHMYEDHVKLKTRHKAMDENDLRRYFKENKIHVIIDATHPYAKTITNNLLRVSEALDIPYLRYLRQSFELDGFETYEAIITKLKKTQGNIFISSGSNHLHEFVKELPMKRLYCRVLPTYSVVKKCQDMKIPIDHIIAMQGPFSEMLNYQMMKEKNIKWLVTKDSGIQGGYFEKLSAAEKLNVEVLVLKRPEEINKEYYTDYNEIIQEIRRLL